MNMYNEFERELIKESIKKLNKKQRRIILLHFYKQLSITEISKNMRMSWIDANSLLEESMNDLGKVFLIYEAQILTKKLIHEFSGIKEMKKIIKKTLSGSGKKIDYVYLKQRKEDDFKRAYGFYF